jgi:putative FmdB family regulatory protein
VTVPTYQYVCTECGEPLEAVQAFTDETLTTCPVCGGRLRKVFSAVGVVFKGSGFYRNDSRKGAAARSGSSSGSGGEGSSGGSGGGSGDGGSTDRGSTDRGSTDKGSTDKGSTDKKPTKDGSPAGATPTKTSGSSSAA